MLVPGAARASRSRSVALAHGQRIAPDIVAVELDEVERPREHVRVMPPISDAI
jgi:hypothetical protein